MKKSSLSKIALFTNEERRKSMSYMSLSKIFYQDTHRYEEVYTQRYNSTVAKHFDIAIKQYNRKNSYPIFLNYTEDMMLLVEQIYKSYEKLLYSINIVPKVVLHQFALLSILDEVQSTNAIEGVRSTRKELKEILDGSASRSARFFTIVHKYNSLLTNEEFKFNTCQDIRTFYDAFAHEEIANEEPNNKLDGTIFRKGSVDIASASGKTLHRGVSPESSIISMMEKSLSILHDEKIPFLVRVSLFHYLFAYIHPFYDGNGRTDRFITTYFLSKHFHPVTALRLSVIAKKNSRKYYSLFSEADSEINRGDMTPFVLGFLELLLDTFNDTIIILERKQKQLKIYEEKILQLALNDDILVNVYFILLQAALFYGQGVSIEDIIKITGKTRNTIQKRLSAIPVENILVKKVHKTRYYRLNMLMFK